MEGFSRLRRRVRTGRRIHTLGNRSGILIDVPLDSLSSETMKRPVCPAPKKERLFRR